MNRSRKWNRRRLAFLAILSCVIALAIGGAMYLSRRPTSSLGAARLFCVVSDWTGRAQHPAQDGYDWLDANTALLVSRPLLLHPPRDGPAYLSQIKSDARNPSDTAMPLPFTLPVTAKQEHVSPNGHFLAYYESAVLAGRPVTYLVVRRMDGSNVLHAEWPTDGQTLWAPDSRSLVQHRGYDARLRRISLATGRVENIRVALPLDYSAEFAGFTDRGTALFAKDGLTFQDPAVLARLGMPTSAVNVPQVSLIEVSLESPSRVVCTYSPTLPSGAGGGFIALSPKGDRLFWGAICATKISPIQVAIHRLLPFIRGNGTIVERGWVSHLDGSHMKEVGFYEMPIGRPSRIHPRAPILIYAPKWTPDGKRISFIYEDRIMTIPAD